ncbi:ATP-dependent Clp protease adapter protein clpS [Alkalidesulfovibrio alkalitolerans DSM 16529]|uniref:ATP-dependent Clp protease adapter protein ClpS n=1 Tax=Alkalidesulfovibrio alkalitolerans DSM 16529 TaxID=1121439 RepID=S7T4X9_9BACT|nr:ATP-dependent Clp protease adapter ClpS [Alkalidesulfovibrio alkalitolerans]EPR31555.1 ATP-dependent Clp protease adapter protein clpS [Alkalidesulfovibrio alkalitolerans DSM 16529]
MSDKMPLERRDADTLLDDEIREPRRYKVLLHNDHYTTMEFVVRVLVEVFHKNEAQATRIMLSVHNQGKGVCGIYTAEVAETKVNMVHNLAKQAGYPLRSSMEEV